MMPNTEALWTFLSTESADFGLRVSAAPAAWVIGRCIIKRVVRMFTAAGADHDVRGDRTSVAADADGAEESALRQPGQRGADIGAGDCCRLRQRPATQRRQTLRNAWQLGRFVPGTALPVHPVGR